MKELKVVNIYTRLQKRDRARLARLTGDGNLYVFDALHFSHQRCGCLNEQDHAAKCKPVSIIYNSEQDNWMRMGSTTWPAVIADSANDLIIACD